MTDKQYFVLSHFTARHNAMEAVRLAPKDYAVTIQPKKRSLEANALAHVVVSAIAEQVEIDGKRFPHDVWWWELKRRFFGRQFQEFPDGTVREVEPRSRWRNSWHFAEFIEFLYSQASDMGVVIPEKKWEVA
jgi:hypothetical protein